MTWEELYAEWVSDCPTLRCHTSGSTGTPKTIDLPKEQVAASARRTLDFFHLDQSARFHSCLAPDYIGGKMMMVRALLAGGCFTWEKPSNHPLRDAANERIDLLCVVPAQMRDILDRRKELPEIGAILIGGSPINSALKAEIAASGLHCWETYGMTETASHVALRPVSEPEAWFTPLDGIAVSLSDSRLAIDIPGWQRLVTNDIAEITSDNRFHIVGRADNVVITGGLKVHPEEVESRLQPYLDFDFILTSRPDALWGQRVVMIAENAGMPDEQILDICRSHAARHEVPKQIIRSAIPRTESGKPVRKQS